jgi:Ca-activated chloride channel homolog
MNNEMNLVINPLRAAVLAGTRSTVDVLVRLQAPARPEGLTTKRGPLHLALVIDRSGSMSGKPLEEARRCARMVVDGLVAGDKAAVVAYDGDIDRLTPLLDISERAALRNAIDSIEEGGCTNLHGGWLAGAELLAPHTAAGALSRVILLSDGNANAGLTDTGAICEQARSLAGAGVSTSTYGLGHHFNEELMTALADAGGGNAYYGQSADDLADPFREELALLDALCARKVELFIETPAGVSCELLNGYARSPGGGWRLPDLAYDGEAWALLRLTVEANVAAAGDTVSLLQAHARWQDLEGVAAGHVPVGLELPAMPAAAYAAVAEDSLVRRRVDEVSVAGLKDTARAAARRHDWDTVERMLAEARRMSRDNPWLLSVVDELESLARRRDAAMFAKEAMYSARRERTRLASRVENLDPAEQSVASFLRRKSAQGKGEPPRGGRGSR